MKLPNLCIVLTTIHDHDILSGYCEQAEAEGVRDSLRVIVIPDRKTPKSLHETCAALTRRGFCVTCPTLREQEVFLDKLGVLTGMIPYDSDNRRNVGFLMALESGSEVLISIDDDNYCRRGDNVYSTYSVVSGEKIELPAVHSSNGWFNVCDLLALNPPHAVYPRGFPYHQRNHGAEIDLTPETATVKLNAGLWLEEPDLDAMTWLVAPVRATSFKGNSYLLSRDAWSPINTQNTSLHRDLIVAYYFIRMGYPLAGLPIDRYGDIFSGFFVQACMQHLGHRIRVGTPVADHRRNCHNYLRDLERELACILTLEDVVQWLPAATLDGTSYPETYLSLADAIDDQVERFTGSIWTDATRGFFHQMTYWMRQWVAVCRTVG